MFHNQEIKQLLAIVFTSGMILLFTMCVGSHGIADPIPGIKSWVLPTTPNGLQPTQCWFAIGGAPDEGMYIAASDHVTNSALYRIDVETEKLELVGDAKSASEAVNNWLPNETAEKFHVRPAYYKGRVYVATTDYSNLDDGYLKKRGFHWYAYDIEKKEFLDLSVNEPGGVAGEHASIMAMTLDEKNGLLYGLETPLGHLFQYDIAAGVTKDLGRPEFLKDKFYNAGRYIWTDTDGRVYFTLTRVDFVMCWDPISGFSAKQDWKLRTEFSTDKNIRIGQWTKDGQRCYLADYAANFYLFDNKDQTFTWLGKGEGESSHFSQNRFSGGGRAFRIRVLNVTEDEKTIYFANDDSEKFSLFAFDLETKETSRLCYLAQLDKRLGNRAFFNRAGNDSWDSKGRFYIASFGTELGGVATEVIITRIDPEVVKRNINRK